MNDVTGVLRRIDSGDASAARELLPLVYESLRDLAAAKMAAELPEHTLQPTALVHEAYLRLVRNESHDNWNSRGHFFSAAAQAMRRILVEHARQKNSAKAGGGYQRVALSESALSAQTPQVDLIILDEALALLEDKDERKAALVKLRYFAGFTNQEAAKTLGISESTAESDWRYAKCWLRQQMSDLQE